MPTDLRPRCWKQEDESLQRWKASLGLGGAAPGGAGEKKVFYPPCPTFDSSLRPTSSESKVLVSPPTFHSSSPGLTGLPNHPLPRILHPLQTHRPRPHSGARRVGEAEEGSFGNQGGQSGSCFIWYYQLDGWAYVKVGCMGSDDVDVAWIWVGGVCDCCVL